MNNRLDHRDILTLSTLLDEGMELRPELIEAWLAALCAEHQHLVDRLREMLTEHASATQSSFMQAGPQVSAVEVSGRAAGQTIGGYTLVREIGRGGMGCVWLAECTYNGQTRRVALKLPRADRGPVPAERMGEEGDIGALMIHPNVVRLLQSGIDPVHGRYIAMEYLEGQPLDTWCDSQSVGVQGRLRLFLQVVHAVAYAHALGIAHLDIKPSNVLVTCDGQVHLLDFGIARRLMGSDVGHAPQQRLRILTPGYSSPEQRCDEPITFASDVYSLGVIFLELATSMPAILPGGGAARLVGDFLRTQADKGFAIKADPRCRGTWAALGQPEDDIRVLRGFIRLGLQCTAADRRERPCMIDIQLALQDLLSDSGGSSSFFARPDLIQAPSGSAPRSCVVCDAAARSVVFLPCSHACTCAACAAVMGCGEGVYKGESCRVAGEAFPCPVCRGPVVSSRPAAGPVFITYQQPELEADSASTTAVTAIDSANAHLPDSEPSTAVLGVASDSAAQDLALGAAAAHADAAAAAADSFGGRRLRIMYV